jgi:hypothetical protein
VLPEVAGVHLGVAVDLCPLESFHLEVAGTLHPIHFFPNFERCIMAMAHFIYEVCA